jgi:hypothetical protein
MNTYTGIKCDPIGFENLTADQIKQTRESARNAFVEFYKSVNNDDASGLVFLDASKGA